MINPPFDVVPDQIQERTIKATIAIPTNVNTFSDHDIDG
jgi:hypothetical protein